jgi:hypothetical protein
VADKQITVAVPEERVPEFYSWFARFLAADPGRGPAPRGRHGRGPHGHRGEPAAWAAEDVEQAAWLYGKLAPPARALFDLLLDAPGERFAGNDIAARLGLDAGAHGVAGILAWPGRYTRRAERAFPISTEGRADGGTDYFIAPAVAEVLSAGRERHRERSG